MTQGILPRDQNFTTVPGAVSSATDSSASIRALQYDPTTRGLTVHTVGSDLVTTTPTIINLTLTDVDTEYEQAIPANTKEFRVRCRTLFDVRYAWETGKVATPTAPYATISAGLEYRGDNSDINDKSLFLASSEAGVIMEIEVWT